MSMKARRGLNVGMEGELEERSESGAGSRRSRILPPRLKSGSFEDGAEGRWGMCSSYLAI